MADLGKWQGKLGIKNRFRPSLFQYSKRFFFKNASAHFIANANCHTNLYKAKALSRGAVKPEQQCMAREVYWVESKRDVCVCVCVCVGFLTGSRAGKIVVCAHLVKSVISIMIMHICLAKTMMSFPLSSHLDTSASSLLFSSWKLATCSAIFAFCSWGSWAMMACQFHRETHI